MTEPKIYAMRVDQVYPHYLNKVEKKNRTQAELDHIITWLTGYEKEDFQNVMTLDFKSFFENAPKLNPKRKAITGVICGVRVESIQEPIMQEIRYLDKLVDELAKGKTLEKILRK